MNKLKCMHAFVLVAKSGSFSEAAAHMAVSRAMVSKYVTALENTLSVRLLNRTTRQVRLTEAGWAYFERVQHILNDIEETELSITSLATQPKGNLRLTAPTSFGAFHLARAIAVYRGAYPEVTIDLVLSEQPRDIVEEGIDLAIRIGSQQDSSLVAQKLAEVRSVVCAAPAYLQQHGRPSTPDDLQQHNCLVYSGRHPLGEWTFSRDGTISTAIVRGDLRCNIGDALRIAAIRGCGLVQLPTYMVGLDIAAERLQRVLQSFEPPPRSMYAVYPHRRHLSAKVRSFVEFLKDAYQTTPYWEQWPGKQTQPSAT